MSRASQGHTIFESTYYSSCNNLNIEVDNIFSADAAAEPAQQDAGLSLYTGYC